MRSDTWLVRLWNVLYPILIHAVLTSAAAALITMAVAIAYAALGKGWNVDEINTITTSAYIIVGNAFVDIIGYLFYRNDKKYVVSVKKKMTILQWVLLAFIGIATCYFGNVLISLSGITQLLEESYESVTELQYSQPLVPEIIGLAIAAPAAEELIFRGLIFKRMRTYCKFPIAMLISALIFGAYHFNAIQFFYAFFAGLVFAFVYEKFRNIWAPILVHMMANLSSLIITENAAIGNFLDKNWIAGFLVSAVVLIGGIYLLKNVLEPKEEEL